jgi:Ca2+-binding RTX toxin-like protein
MYGDDVKDVNGTAGGWDWMDGEAGNDTIYGCGGSDQILQDNLSVPSGNDQIFGGAGSDNVAGGDGDDTIYGGPGDDSLSANSGYDELYGGDGDDWVDVFDEAGGDLLDGGAGYDNGGLDTDENGQPTDVLYSIEWPEVP